MPLREGFAGYLPACIHVTVTDEDFDDVLKLRTRVATFLSALKTNL